MSREMMMFTQQFLKGLDRGAAWGDKAEQRAVARERNKIMQERNAAVDKRENIKLGLYGEQVRANAERSRAQAYKALHPTAKGGGGGGGGEDPAVTALHQRAAERGIVASPPSSGGGNTYNNTVNEAAEVDQPDAPAPVEGGYGDNGGEVQTEATGGMVRKMASGGAVAKYDDGGMTLEQAQSYSAGYTPRADPKKPAATANYNSSYATAAKAAADRAAKKPDGTIKNAAPTATGPVGSGPAGSYTTQDVRPGGVLDTTSMGIGGTDYRRGGGVRRFADGGPVRYAKNEEKLIKSEATPGMADIPVGKGRLSLGANYDPNSKYGSAEAGYEHPVGRDTTIGIRGDIGKDLGPDGASAKPNWGVGVRGRIKFAEGGSVMKDKDDPMNAAGPKLSPFVQKYIDDYNSGVTKQGEMPSAGGESQRSSGGGFGDAFSSAMGSADGGTGNSGGVGGNGVGDSGATGGVGGSAGVSGEGADSGTGGTYRGGGRVRRFASGGRVMEAAIDTGTSGPGSGYGYRAAPPARRY